MVGGTNRGGPGRPSDEWKKDMRELRDRGLQVAKAHDILGQPNHPNWLGALKFVHEAVEGRAAQAVDLTTQGEKLPGVIILPAELAHE